jgi:hypothetical protein
MMKIHLLYCGVILISFIPVVGNHQETKSDSVTAAEYAVYSALLNEIKISPSDGIKVKLLVINDQTKGPYKSCFPEEIAKWDGRIKADELKPLFADLIEKNRGSKSLDGKFSVNKKYVLLNVQNFSSIFKKKDFEGWDDFYQKYPASSGYITFSRVGFNSDGTKAVIYRETVCGTLCGYGGYILLSKDNGAWKEIDGYGCWMS